MEPVIPSATATLAGVSTAYAQADGGRFVLYGSAARGQMKWDSDVDLLLDFPEEQMSEAWSFAEQTCRDLNLLPDILPFRGCKPEFLAHIESEMKVLA